MQRARKKLSLSKDVQQLCGLVLMGVGTAMLFNVWAAMVVAGAGLILNALMEK